MGYYSDVSGSFVFSELDSEKMRTFSPTKLQKVLDHIKDFYFPKVSFHGSEVTVSFDAYIKAYDFVDDMKEVVGFVLDFTGAKAVSGYVERIGEESFDLEVCSVESVEPLKMKRAEVVKLVFSDGTERQLG